MKYVAIILLLLLAFVPIMAHAEMAQDEGYNLTDQGIDITLFGNDATGYQWNYEIDDEELIALIDEKQSGAGAEGAGMMYTWAFKTAGEGEVLLAFDYERAGATEDEENDDMPARTICYTITIEDGKVVDCIVEDLTDVDEGDGEEAVAEFTGDTGGVPLEIEAGMTQTETEDGVQLVSEDGETTILVDYDRTDDADELFEKLKDEESAAAMYNDAAKGIELISYTMDTEDDIQNVTLAYYTKGGVEVYTGYRAPNGGVLHVHTTYKLDDGLEEGEDDGWEEEEEDSDEESV